jgi:hypothetical protein
LGGDCHSVAGCRLSSDAPALAAIKNAATVNTGKITNITIKFFILDLHIPMLVRLFVSNNNYLDQYNTTKKAGLTI